MAAFLDSYFTEHENSLDPSLEAFFPDFSLFVVVVLKFPWVCMVVLRYFGCDNVVPPLPMLLLLLSTFNQLTCN